MTKAKRKTVPKKAVVTRARHDKWVMPESLKKALVAHIRWHRLSGDDW